MLYQLNYCPAQHLWVYYSLALFVNSVFPAAGAEFLQLHSVRMLAFVASSRIITILAFFAGKDNDVSHFSVPAYVL